MAMACCTYNIEAPILVLVDGVFVPRLDLVQWSVINGSENLATNETTFFFFLHRPRWRGGRCETPTDMSNDLLVALSRW